MRVSTNMIYDHGVASIQDLWSSLLHTSQEVTTGRRVLTPADDPIAAARALDVTQSQSINAQFMANQDYALDNLRLLENKLAGAVDIYQYVRQGAIAAGDGILESELGFFVTDVRSQFDALLALANTQDASGDFLFAGYKANTLPFQGQFGGIHYEGDQGMRTMQVSSTRFMPVSFPGADVFDNTRTMQDSILAFAGKGNSAGAAVSVAFNPSPPAPGDTGRRYEVSFDGTAYNVIEHVPGNPAPVPVTATLAGSTLSFEGLEMDVSSFTTAGDAFDVFVSSQNVFDNLAVFVDTLERPGVSGVISGVQFAIGNLDYALETATRTRAQIGSQLVELDQLKDLGSELNIEYADTLSRLQDGDYAEAISRLTQQKTYLEAAQQSFLKVSGLSLFNYIS
jgi:flagellar hook-associated protein 3 FlgL